jgi:hypothetical protein
MSKKWKIAIGVVIAAVVVAGVALAAWGAVTFRNKAYEYGWRPGEWRTEAATQLEVRLVDDDGDGVPDRGVIEAPAGLPFGRGSGPGRRLPFGPGHGPHFGRGFGPSTLRRDSGQALLGTGPHFGWGFGPFFIVGGLFRLAFLALLIGLGVACFRCWSRAKEAREPQRG